MKKLLETSEWILSGSLILILTSLLIISRFHEHRKKQELLSFSPVSKGCVESVEVSISGGVSRPGVYSALAGTRIGDLIKKSRPKQFADLRGIDLDGLVENSIHLAIPELTEITVRITGAVSEEVEFTVPVGSRICDLKSKVQLDGCADVDFFKRRRVLKSEEVIVIPRKDKKAKGVKN